MSHKAIFLDRDDTVVDDPGYISRPEQVKLLPGVIDALKSFKSLGYKLIIVSNQSAVARGMIDENQLSKIHARLERILANDGVFLDNIYYCPFHPEGKVEQYSKESEFRKPNSGMLIQASEEMNIDLENSWMIGDSYRDVEAGARVGCKTILINSPAKPSKKKTNDPNPDFEAVNIKESANIVRMSISKKNSSKKSQKNEIPQAIKSVKEKVVEKPKFSPNNLASIHKVNTAKTISQEVDTKKPARNSRHSSKELLHEIVSLLKKDNRSEMYHEFSLVKFLSGLLQAGAAFCLLAAVWVMIEGGKTELSIFKPLAFAIVLQLMCLTLYMMDNQK